MVVLSEPDEVGRVVIVVIEFAQLKTHRSSFKSNLLWMRGHHHHCPAGQKREFLVCIPEQIERDWIDIGRLLALEELAVKKL